jgi:hypothetical protein
MSSTTEELTGQSEQLVSALAFFNTGEEERVPSRQAKAQRPAAGAHLHPVHPARPSRSAAVPSAKPAARGGVALRLNDHQDDSDGEFERY